MPAGNINGEEMQRDCLDQLVFDVPKLIAYVSKAMPWRPGDVLVTGTPGGVGFSAQAAALCHPGDTVEVAITGIGTLSNGVKDEA